MKGYNRKPFKFLNRMFSLELYRQEYELNQYNSRETFSDDEAKQKI